jgi:hypothetical protein
MELVALAHLRPAFAAAARRARLFRTRRALSRLRASICWFTARCRLA